MLSYIVTREETVDRTTDRRCSSRKSARATLTVDQSNSKLQTRSADCPEYPWTQLEMSCATHCATQIDGKREGDRQVHVLHSSAGGRPCLERLAGFD